MEDMDREIPMVKKGQILDRHFFHLATGNIYSLLNLPFLQHVFLLKFKYHRIRALLK